MLVRPGIDFDTAQGWQQIGTSTSYNLSECIQLYANVESTASSSDPTIIATTGYSNYTLTACTYAYGSDGKRIVDTEQLKMTYQATIFDPVTRSENQQYQDYAKMYQERYALGYTVGFDAGVFQAEEYSVPNLVIALFAAPAEFITTMLDFNVFGINIANTVKAIFTIALLAFVVIMIVKVVKA